MKGNNFSLLILGLVSGLNLFKCDNIGPRKDWKSEEITQLMTLLKQYGEEKLNEYNSHAKRQEAIANQFLVVSVLSEAEMIDSGNWQQLPNTMTHNNARVDFIVNSKSKKCGEINLKCDAHGEVLMLYERKDLGVMTENLNGEYGYAVLYSHYIPCSDVPKIEYSCAEELGNHARYNHDKYSMLVGYNEIFSNTNEAKSIDFMIMAGIELFQLQGDVFVPISSNRVNNIKTERFLQNLFYGCLDLTKVSEKCCIANNPDDKKEILARYVNDVVYSCTKTSPLKGELTGVHKLAIRQCIDEYVEKHTGQDCPHCGVKIIMDSIKVCSYFASEFGTEIGRPSNLNEPYLPSWGKGPPEWESIYKDYNIDADLNRPGIFCLLRTAALDSLCTKLDIGKEDITSKARKKIKDLRESEHETRRKFQ